jgi:hypothetical protein
MSHEVVVDFLSQLVEGHCALPAVTIAWQVGEHPARSRAGGLTSGTSQ